MEATEVITIPEGKKITLSRTVYKLAEPVEVPASALGEPEKKQATKMRPLICPACGCKLRGTRKYMDRLLVCGGSKDAPHEGTEMVWLDSVTPEEGEGAGE